MNALPQRPLARDNPWYVLATIMGEPTGRADKDKTLQVENRKVWNAWASQGLSDEEKREKSQKSGPDPFEGVEPWSEIRDHIEAEFKKRLPDKEIPDPSERVDFRKLSFEVPVSFKLFFFQEDANFKGATFTGRADFRGATFTGLADFEYATFTGLAHFIDATFTDGAHFEYATFTGLAHFEYATFTEDANFSGTAFEGRSYFQKAIFKGSVDFTDASFDKPCNLREATFTKEYPCLEGTNLHAKTTITADDGHWPKKNTDEKKDKEAMTSCAHLRHNMAAQGLPDHAHFFFRREMALKSQTVSGRERGWYWAYRISSNFGHSLWRPFLGLVCLCLFMAGVLCLVDCPTSSALNPLKHSFANMFPSFLFSAGEHFPDSLLVHAPWLEWLMWAQTILGSALVFLFILGLRNRFRL